MVAPDIQLPQAARALGAMLEDGDQELLLKVAVERLRGHCLLQVGNLEESKQPIRRSRLCERLEHNTVAIRASRIIKNLRLCALIQGFGQPGLHYAADKIRILKERRIEIWNKGAVVRLGSLGSGDKRGSGCPEKTVQKGGCLRDGDRIGTGQKGSGLSDAQTPLGNGHSSQGLLQRAKTTATSCDNGLEDLGLEQIEGHQSLLGCIWRHCLSCENHFFYTSFTRVDVTSSSSLLLLPEVVMHPSNRFNGSDYVLRLLQ
eukprot:jgi/Botrbrau1/15640/Bobra.4_1s0025.1